MPAFNTGNPSLVGLTRLYGRDPSSAAQPTWTDQQIKDAVNLAYDSLLDLARQLDVDWGLATAYDTAVDGTEQYTLPTGFVRFQQVEISKSGKDLSTTAPSAADIVVLRPLPYAEAREEHDTRVITAPSYYAVLSSKVAILSPPTAAYAGTNSIKFIYEKEETLLSADGDEPIFPRAHHNLISLQAAELLLGSRNLPFPDELLRQRERALRAYQVAVQDRAADHDDQIGSAGLTSNTNRTIKMGTTAHA